MKHIHYHDRDVINRMLAIAFSLGLVDKAVVIKSDKIALAL